MSNPSNMSTHVLTPDRRNSVSDAVPVPRTVSSLSATGAGPSRALSTCVTRTSTLDAGRDLDKFACGLRMINARGVKSDTKIAGSLLLSERALSFESLKKSRRRVLAGFEYIESVTILTREKSLMPALYSKGKHKLLVKIGTRRKSRATVALETERRTTVAPPTVPEQSGDAGGSGDDPPDSSDPSLQRRPSKDSVASTTMPSATESEEDSEGSTEVTDGEADGSTGRLGKIWLFLKGFCSCAKRSGGAVEDLHPATPKVLPKKENSVSSPTASTKARHVAKISPSLFDPSPLPCSASATTYDPARIVSGLSSPRSSCSSSSAGRSTRDRAVALGVTYSLSGFASDVAFLNMVSLLRRALDTQGCDYELVERDERRRPVPVLQETPPGTPSPRSSAVLGAAPPQNSTPSGTSSTPGRRSDASERTDAAETAGRADAARTSPTTTSTTSPSPFPAEHDTTESVPPPECVPTVTDAHNHCQLTKFPKLTRDQAVHCYIKKAPILYKASLGDKDESNFRNYLNLEVPLALPEIVRLYCFEDAPFPFYKIPTANGPLFPDTLVEGAFCGDQAVSWKQIQQKTLSGELRAGRNSKTVFACGGGEGLLQSESGSAAASPSPGMTGATRVAPPERTTTNPTRRKMEDIWTAAKNDPSVRTPKVPEYAKPVLDVTGQTPWPDPRLLSAAPDGKHIQKRYMQYTAPGVGALSPKTTDLELCLGFHFDEQGRFYALCSTKVANASFAESWRIAHHVFAEELPAIKLKNSSRVLRRSRIVQSIHLNFMGMNFVKPLIRKSTWSNFADYMQMWERQLHAVCAAKRQLLVQDLVSEKNLGRSSSTGGAGGVVQPRAMAFGEGGDIGGTEGDELGVERKGDIEKKGNIGAGGGGAVEVDAVERGSRGDEGMMAGGEGGGRMGHAETLMSKMLVPTLCTIVAVQAVLLACLIQRTGFSSLM